MAINQGTRYVGFGAFRGLELIDWGVRAISAKTPRGTIRVAGQILKEAIERFQPDALVLKHIHASRTSTLLDRLTDSIRELSHRRKLKFHQFSITELKEILCSDAESNHRRLAAEVVAMYPVLSYDFNREKTNRHPYYLRMFEAVALGIAYYRLSGE